MAVMKTWLIVALMVWRTEAGAEAGAKAVAEPGTRKRGQGLDLISQDSSSSFAVIDHHGRQSDFNHNNRNWRQDRHSLPYSRSSSHNHNLRIVSHKGTYPFESEVTGDGYHSRIRFDPFGSIVRRPKLPSLPKREKIHSWQSTTESSIDLPSSQQKNSNPFFVPDRPLPTGDDFDNYDIVDTSHTLDYETEPSPQPPKSSVFSSSPWRHSEHVKSNTPLPLAVRPFAPPVSLAALVGSDAPLLDTDRDFKTDSIFEDDALNTDDESVDALLNDRDFNNQNKKYTEVSSVKPTLDGFKFSPNFFGNLDPIAYTTTRSSQLPLQNNFKYKDEDIYLPNNGANSDQNNTYDSDRSKTESSVLSDVVLTTTEQAFLPDLNLNYETRNSGEIIDDYYADLYQEFIEMYYDDPLNITDDDIILDDVPELDIEQINTTIKSLKSNKEDIVSISSSSTPIQTSTLSKDVTSATPLLSTEFITSTQSNPVTTSSNYPTARQTTESTTTVTRPLPTRFLTRKPVKSTSSTSTTIENTSSTRSTVPHIPRTSTTTVISTSGISAKPKVESQISLSEILQDLGLPLPIFLGKLKAHDISLKEFTALLKEKSFKKQDLIQAQGDLGKIIDVLNNNSEDIREELNNKEGIQNEKEEVKDNQDNDKDSTLSEIVPPWLTQKPLWVSTTAKKDSSSITSAPEITSKENPPVKTFGFRPNDKTGLSKEILSKKTDSSEQVEKSPISIKLDILKLMKEKGLDASEILTGMFNLNSSKVSKDKEPATLHNKDTENNTTTTAAYTLAPGVSLRPYVAGGGAEVYKPRRPSLYGADAGGVGIIRTRLGSTKRTTLYPRYVYSPKPKQYEENKENEALTTENVPEVKNNESDKTKFKDNLFDKYYNTKPQIPGASSTSAIMAGAIIGGVALLVFLAILVVVLCRSYMVRSRHRVPFPLSSDSSSTSTPPIYSNRMSLGKGPYKSAGFWGTLKKRFDPYSLSSTPTSLQ